MNDTGQLLTLGLGGDVAHVMLVGLSPAGGNIYNDALSLEKTDAINQSGNLIIDAVIGTGVLEFSEQVSVSKFLDTEPTEELDIEAALNLAYVQGILTSLGASTYNLVIDLARASGLALSGWVDMGAQVILGKSLAIELLGGFVVTGAITLDRQAGISNSALKALSETMSLARVAGIDEAEMLTLAGAVSLARLAGMSEVAQYDLAGAVNLNRIGGISIGGIMTVEGALSLARWAGISESSIANLVDTVTLSRVLSISEVLEVFAAIITAVCRIYVVPAEDREYTPLDSLVYVVPAEDREYTPLDSLVYVVPAESRVVEAGCPTQ